MEREIDDNPTVSRDGATAPVAREPPLYTAQFFQVFVATLLFMTGIALQFHFGQFVAFVGHGPETLGRILGISMAGSLAVRLHVGGWVDRFGCRPAWLTGTAIVAIAIAAIQFTHQLWAITLLRALWALASCLVMTTVAVFAAQIAPPQRRAESIGMLGLAGLLGIMIGPTIGDMIFADEHVDAFSFHVFFTASAICALASGLVIRRLHLPRYEAPQGSASETLCVECETVSLATDDAHPNAGIAANDPIRMPQHRIHSALSRDVIRRAGVGVGRMREQWQVIRRYWPGGVLWVGFVFSMVFCLQSSFLERLAEQRGFLDVKAFFLVYSPTAIILRIIFRRLPQQIGRTRTLVIGMASMCAGVFILIGAQSQAQLILPGILMGTGHCFIFPSMVDLAADRFPMQHRGTATALILAAGDVGMILGYASIGESVDQLGFATTLKMLVAVVAGTTILFAISRRQALLRRLLSTS